MGQKGKAHTFFLLTVGHSFWCPKQKGNPSKRKNPTWLPIMGQKNGRPKKKGTTNLRRQTVHQKMWKAEVGHILLKPSKREQQISLPIIRQNNLKGPSGPSKWKRQKLETRSSSLVEGPRFEFQYLWIGQPSYTLKIYGAGWGQLYLKNLWIGGSNFILKFWNFVVEEPSLEHLKFLDWRAHYVFKNLWVG